MALLFPWATKEYLLWKMSIGQIVMYHNIGTDLKYGTGETTNGKPTLMNKSHSELKAKRQQLIAQGLIEEAGANDEAKQPYRDKYGEID